MDITRLKSYTKNPLTSMPNDGRVFLLTDSFEYDIRLIENMTSPGRVYYKNIVLPFKVPSVQLGINYEIDSKEFSRRVEYMQSDSKLIPKPVLVKYEKKEDLNNINGSYYIPISGYIDIINRKLKQSKLPKEKLCQNLPDILYNVFKPFESSKSDIPNILVVDIERYPLYKNIIIDEINNDIINGILFSAYLSESKIRRMNLIIVFRSLKTNSDYKIDLSNDITSDKESILSMMEEIGTMVASEGNINADDYDNTNYEALIEDEMERITDDTISNVQNSSKTVARDLEKLITSLKTKYGVKELNDAQQRDSLYYAKTMNINAQLLAKINQSKNAEVNNYKQIAKDLTPDGSTDIEKKYIDDASKQLAGHLQSTDKSQTKDIVSSSREFAIRANMLNVKLNKNDIEKLSNVTDVPLPAPSRPRNISTTNPGAMRGTGFADVSKAYENEMLDKDIVAVFKQLEKIPNGFEVKNIEVTDISTVLSLVNNWKVSLKSKESGLTSTINVHIPIVRNGRFFINGAWNNIGKQDFPIPILKTSSNKVMLTSNYNKISVTRYDTHSLVDIGMLAKVMNKQLDESGNPKYTRAGSFVNTNRSYVSTIEFDEYAKKWRSIIIRETHFEAYFSRIECLKRYGDISVQPNEFCCGMFNKVPIVINTDTGLTRAGITLTDTILNALPESVMAEYKKLKPTKIHMYTEIEIGRKYPLGVACCAWEGITSVLNKSQMEFKFVDKSFDDHSYLKFVFKDKILAIKNSLSAQLLFNGLYKLNTKAHTYAEFDVPILDQQSIYVDIFNSLFFSAFSQLTTFISRYRFFVDPITAEVCDHYGIPNDLVGMLIYASDMLGDNEHVDESNASLYRIRSTEIIPGILHYLLATEVAKYTNNSGSKARGNLLAFTPNALISQLQKVENVSTMSALNPVIELHAKESITKKGYAGLNVERAYTEAKRSYNSTMISKIAMSSPNNANVGVQRQLVIDPNVESVRGYTKIYSPDDKKNDLQLASFTELLTPGTITRDDAIRTAIAGSQSGHMIATEDAAPVLISNGVDEIVPSYLTDEFSVVADDDGKVIDMNDQYMIIEYKDKKKKAINIAPKYSFNSGSGFYVNNKLKTTFQVNDKFQKGDILAYHEKFFHKGTDGVVRYCMGPIAKVAFTDTYSTYEDAGLITRKMSKRLGTSLTMCQQIKISATDQIDQIVKVGDVVEIGDPLVTFGLGDTGDKSVDKFLQAFGNNSNDFKRTKNAKSAGTVVAVKMYTNKALTSLSPSLFELLNEHFKENKKRRKILDKYDSSSSPYKLDTLYDYAVEPIKASSIKGINTDVLIEVYIEHADEVSVGDKLAVYAASKQIISEVIPEGMEPFSESNPNEEISIFVSSTSVLRRMIPSIMIIGGANKVLINLKEKIRELYNNS